MKFPNWFRITWWILLLMLTVFILYKRYDDIVSGHSVPLDIFIFLIFIALMLVPVFSEIEFFGIKLKKEIGELKKDIGEIKNDIRNTQVQSVHNIIHGLGPPPPDNKLPEITNEIDRLVGDGSINQGMISNTDLSHKIEVPEDNVLLFRVRYTIEKEIRRIWRGQYEKGDQESLVKNQPPYRMLLDLKEDERIDNNLYGILREILSICNYAIHGERVTENQVSFVKQNANKVIFYLSKIK